MMAMVRLPVRYAPQRVSLSLKKKTVRQAGELRAVNVRTTPLPDMLKMVH